MDLPADLHPGDLVALPAHGPITLSDVDPHRHPHADASTAAPTGHCGR
jgi:hypothetical protein